MLFTQLGRAFGWRWVVLRERDCAMDAISGGVDCHTDCLGQFGSGSARNAAGCVRYFAILVLRVETRRARVSTGLIRPFYHTRQRDSDFHDGCVGFKVEA